MFYIVNKSQVSLDGNKLVAEASSIELSPGDWPDFISVVDDSGSGFLFQRGDPFNHNEEFAGFNYYTRGGSLSSSRNIQLVVFND